MLESFTDHPDQIDYRQWHDRFEAVPDELIETTRYYRHLPEAGWSQYLFPPSTHAVYGMRLLRKLKYDNSLAALRHWGFLLSEGERIYRASQAGMNVIALMGDLGAVTPLIYSFPNTVAFYPDCLWWTPFLMESRVLFDEAAEFGLGEDCCYVRAALGGFSKRAYFPEPDLCVGTVGATCDDMAAVTAEAEYLGYRVHYFELPLRDDHSSGSEPLVKFLKDQYQGLCHKLEMVTGEQFNLASFKNTIGKVNRLRSTVRKIKRAVSKASVNPMGALEILNTEFSLLSYYGDLDECLDIHLELLETIKRRSDRQIGYSKQDIRLLWITPPADPLLMNYIEDSGGRVVGSEYIINQTKPLIDENPDPFEALARAHIQGSMMGSTDYRIRLILEELADSKADGAIISGVFGSTHCPYETAPIIGALRSRGVPVLAFDVIAPGKKKMQSQTLNRMEAFMESLRTRKLRNMRMGNGR